MCVDWIFFFNKLYTVVIFNLISQIRQRDRNNNITFFYPTLFKCKYIFAKLQYSIVLSNLFNDVTYGKQSNNNNVVVKSCLVQTIMRNNKKTSFGQKKIEFII